MRLGSVTLKETLSTSNTNMSPSVSFTLPASISEGFGSRTEAQINTASANIVATIKYGSASGKMGVYYNFCAASAGTICTDSNSSDASYDICPSGWMIPYGNTANKSYYYLYNTGYSGNADIFRNALSTPFSGRYINNSISNLDILGSFVSSTHQGIISVYDLGTFEDRISPQGSTFRDYGFSVRCVAK